MQTTDTPAQAIDQEPAKPSWRERPNTELEKIVRLFSSQQLPDLCVKALIAAPEKPSSKWSFGNQLLMLLAGTADARGYRQWQDVGRHVRKGSKAFYILGPVLVEKPLDESAEEKDEIVKFLVGFRTIPVFRCEDTEGTELHTYTPRDPPPLLDVAERFGMRVNYVRLSAGVYGMTDYERKVISLATESWDVFFHELAHALHRSFEPKTGHDQETEVETIAQLVAATLSRLYEKPADGFSWTYIAGQAQSGNPQQVGRLCLRVLDRAKKVLDLIYPNTSAAL
ncbi:MAG TPA: ArdC family protein [Nitrososphaerales archaeon]|nr:ArdC family protein [Nitrososphaerales archaeon]